MNKIILISCVLSIALSAAAPSNGFIGCSNDGTTFCAKGTCTAATGICTCPDKLFGFNCAQSSALITPTVDLTSCAATVAVGAQLATACNTSLGTALTALNWKIAENTFTQFANFAIVLIQPRTAAFTFTTAQLQNALDFAEYQWIYKVYNNVGTSLPTTFATDANKTLAIAYIGAVKNVVDAFMIGNVFQKTSTQNNVTDNATAANKVTFTTSTSSWASQIYAIDTTSGANLGVTSVTTGILVNTLDAAFGSAWSTTNAIVGYQQLFKQWGNPGVAFNKGCLYSALIYVQKLTTKNDGTSASNTFTTIVTSDFAADKVMKLVFSDEKIDEKYNVGTQKFDLSGDGEAKAAACASKTCTVSLKISTNGPQLAYVISTVLSNFLISFSLILSALTLSL